MEKLIEAIKGWFTRLSLVTFLDSEEEVKKEDPPKEEAEGYSVERFKDGKITEEYFYKYHTRVEGETVMFLISMLTEHYYRFNHVFLYDINYESKPPVFWRTLGYHTAVKFQEDVVILNCKTKEEAEGIANTIDRSFARAVAFSNSELVADNEW